MAFTIVRNDITQMDTEAIVNTANEYVEVGPGCDSAVYKAAGYDELLAYRRERIGDVPEGDVFITPGFQLKARYIIHAVSPFYRGGNEGEEVKLRSCYRKSLLLAVENGIRSIAFPLISTGGYGYPKEEGLRIAVDEFNAFLLNHDMDICLVVFDDRAKDLGERLYPGLEEYIDRNYVEDKQREEYGEAYEASAMESLMAEPVREPAQRPSNAVKAGRRRFFGAREENRPAGMRPSPAQAKPSEKGVSDGAAGEEDVQEDYPDFPEVHESRLEERIRHLSDTFSEYLIYLIRVKKMENKEVYKRAIVDKKIFSKIKNNPDYHPGKLTALCLCVGAKLNLDESRDLLARAGYALSPCDKTDIIFSYFIENEIYDMIELDIQLEEHGVPCIIS